MKKTISILIILCMTLSLLFANSVSAAPAVTFSDVTAGTELGDSIYKLVASGAVVGYPDGTFKPDNHLTRAELTKMINLVFGYTEADTTGFNDVTDADWFKPYVLVAKKAGYIMGFEDGSFRGNQNLSREQACAIVSRCAALKETKMIINISDEVSDWAETDVKKVIAAGYMKLEQGEKFRAKEDITRGELAMLLVHFIKPAPIVTPPPVINQGGSTGGNGGGTEYHTVTLELNGGTLPEGKSTTLSRADGTTLSSSDITSPSKDGHSFGGWFTDAALTKPFTSKNVVSGFKLYAKWILNTVPTYKVTFKTDASVSNDVTVEEGTKVSRPNDPSKAGYTFAGWYSDEACTSEFNFDTQITSDTTVYAKWTINSYIVSFETYGGSETASQTVTYGSKATVPAQPQRAGFTFGGWYKDSSMSEEFDFNSDITSDTTIYAKWVEIKKYIVTFNFNGGTLDGQEELEVEVTEGETVSDPGTPVKESLGRIDYEFNGYVTTRDGETPFDFDTPINKKTNVYASWKEVASAEDQQELYDNLSGIITAITNVRPRPTGKAKIILTDNLLVAFKGAKQAYENGETITKEFLKENYSDQYDNAKFEYDGMTEGEGGEQEEFLNYCFYNFDPYMTFLIEYFGVFGY